VIFASNESIKKGKAEYKDKCDLRDNLSPDKMLHKTFKEYTDLLEKENNGSLF